MKIIQPYLFQKTTAFKERFELANKINEIIEFINSGGSEIPSEIEERIEEIENDIDDFNTSIESINGKITALESSLSGYVPLNTYNAKITELETEIDNAIAGMENYVDLETLNTKLRDGSVTKLGNDSIGNMFRPIFWSNGKPSSANEFITTNTSQVQTITAGKNLTINEPYTFELNRNSPSLDRPILQIRNGKIHTPYIQARAFEELTVIEPYVWRDLFNFSNETIYDNTLQVNIIDVMIMYRDGVHLEVRLIAGDNNLKVIKLAGDGNVNDVIFSYRKTDLHTEYTVYGKKHLFYGEDTPNGVYKAPSAVIKPYYDTSVIRQVYNVFYGSRDLAFFRSGNEYTELTYQGKTIPNIDNYDQYTWVSLT